MMTPSRLMQLSFGLARQTVEHLDATAEASGESRNALVNRLLSEALKAERHPLIRWRSGAARPREPMLVGTRPRVRDIIATVTGHDNDVNTSAEYLNVPRGLSLRR